MERGPRGSGVAVDPLRVRRARLEAGLSLAQVAGDDVSRTFILFIEQGRSRPSQPVLALIARRTGKPLSYFLRPGIPDGQAASDLAHELIRVAGQVRRFGALRSLTLSEHEAMRLMEVTLDQGAQMIRAMQKRIERGSRGLPSNKRKTA